MPHDLHKLIITDFLERAKTTFILFYRLNNHNFKQKEIVNIKILSQNPKSKS